MLRLSVDYTTEPDDIAPGFSGYVAAMTGHCPFLGPSLQRSLTRWLHRLPDLQREIFAAAVEHMELLRDQHRSRPSAEGVLFCDNLAVRWIGVQDATAHRRALAWPHWMLKTEDLEDPHPRSSEALFAYQNTHPAKIFSISVNDRGQPSGNRLFGCPLSFGIQQASALSRIIE